MNTNPFANISGKVLCLALCAVMVRFAAADEPKITERKVSVGAFVDVGQIVSGSIDDGQGQTTDLEGAFLNRNGIALTYSGTLNDNLHMNIGVGGLFWKAIPEGLDEGSRRILFGPGISEASAQYDFTPALNVKFGFFGYKYNPDAVNLGEYLLKSESYPVTARTAGPGGWVWMNSQEYKSMGVKLTWDMMGGALRHDLMIFSEFNETPIYDFSPSYVLTFKTASVFEMGAGVSLHRFIPIKPSVTTPTRSDNTYVRYENFPEVEWHAKVTGRRTDGSALDTNVVWRGNTPFNSATMPADVDKSSLDVRYTQLGSPAGVREGTKDEVAEIACSACGGTYINATMDSVAEIGADGLPTGNMLPIAPSKTEHLTFKGINLMARASLNLGALFGMEEARTGSFRLFTEAGVIGVQNQAPFYNKITDRIPIMLGINIPTFGLLTKLAVQMEYFKNPLPDNTLHQFQDALPQPALPAGASGTSVENRALYQYYLEKGRYKEDDMKWTVFVHRNLFTGLDLFVQAANDHFRVQNQFAEPSYAPVTHLKKDWYYMLRFQWSM